MRTNCLIALCAVFSLCISCNESPLQNGVVTVDVTKSYPVKELVLQDFMDVEYVALESSDEFLCQGFVQDVTDKHILVRNFRHTGDIFIFDRQGKGVKHFNRRGQGGEEYLYVLEMVFDEETGLLYVNDLGRKILVYDSEGNFVRSFKVQPNDQYHPVTQTNYNMLRNFNSEYLICKDIHVSPDMTNNGQSILLVSKEDGHSQSIQIPFTQSKTSTIIKREGDITWQVKAETEYPLVPCQGSWILVEPSADTIYTFSAAGKTIPLIVRTPSVQGMQPEVFLFPTIATRQYYFMETVVCEYDFKRKKGYPTKSLVYDREKEAIYECKVYNADYTNKKEIRMNYLPLNNEVAACQVIQAHDLIVDYKMGLLKGRLKEIASTLDEESNPVLMFYKQK